MSDDDDDDDVDDVWSRRNWQDAVSHVI